MLFERKFETGRISVMRGSRQVLVKLSIAFSIKGRSHPQADAMPNFFPDSIHFFIRAFQ